MPNLTVTLTDAQFVQVQSALASLDADGRTVTPNQAQVNAWLKRQLYGKVLQKEIGAADPHAAKVTALASQGW
jgi:hypothetical protein